MGGVVAFGTNGALGTLTVEVADDDGERAQGLMAVEELPPDDGMAFVFDEATEATFWMKDTLIPLSIAFIDADGTIVTIHEMTPCTTETCRSYGASQPYILAIEANRGWYEAHSIEVGDMARLQVATIS
jgi:hypothetical protein